MNNSGFLRDNLKLRQILLGITLWAIAVVFMLPVYYLIVSTLKGAEEVTLYPFALPKTLNISKYITAWNKMSYPRAFFNTFTITSLSVLFSTLIASVAAYSIARHKSRFNKFVFFLVLSGIMIPGQVSLVSLYNIVRRLGLMDNILGLVVIYSGSSTVLPLFLIKNFISTTIPIELEEAAKIDGCSLYKTFFSIVFPLLRPIIATVIIITALGIWNDYLNPMLFLQSRKNATILLEINRNIGQFAVDWSGMFPMLVLGIAPLSLFYLFMQKYVISGVVAGAVKG
ncbi:MAG TPA: carbohydrate ABC transporter permease [Candidatus Atribacteria bacterium]|nr:carbohydrate ABC transporter permease [Candidatus Atribacteria bacterium]